MDCSLCNGTCSYGDNELGIDIKLIGNMIRISGYNPMGWRKETRFQINFCPLCGRAVEASNQIENDAG